MKPFPFMAALAAVLLLGACERTVIIRQPVPADAKTSPPAESGSSKAEPAKPADSKDAAPPPPPAPPPGYKPEMPTKPTIGN